MSDPSERFAEILDCGCEYHAGTWFYCVAHQPMARPVTAADLSEVPPAVAQPEPPAPWETT